MLAFNANILTFWYLSMVTSVLVYASLVGFRKNVILMDIIYKTSNSCIISFDKWPANFPSHIRLSSSKTWLFIMLCVILFTSHIFGRNFIQRTKVGSQSQNMLLKVISCCFPMIYMIYNDLLINLINEWIMWQMRWKVTQKPCALHTLNLLVQK